MDILQGLNNVQCQAATQMQGPILIIAGAGSGKTRTLTYRIAYLLSQGVSPYSIMALTFTKKAASEMIERIEELVGAKAKSILAGTFHSVFARMLRIDGNKIGYTSNFTIYDDDDSKKLIGTIVKELHLDEKMYKRDRVLHRISIAKSALYSPKDYEMNDTLRAQDTVGRVPQIYQIYAIYQRRLRQAMAMDFDDILFNMNVLLRDYPEVLHKYQHKFEYILVDEYQDTNYAQYLVVKQLADYYKNICVVGDDAQSIYSFRGANIENILSFKQHYPEANVYKLEQNYRSTGNIISAANSVIENNENQIPKKLFTNNEQGQKVSYCTLETDRQEAEWVADKIEVLSKEGISYNDMAILYRTNTQSRTFEDCLRLRNIPYKIYKGLSFYQRKEIKDCLAYLRLVVNNSDDEAFERIVNYPARGLGQTTIDRLKIARNQMAAEHNQTGLSLFSTAKQLKNNNPWNIRTKALRELEKFCLMIESFTQRVQQDNAYELGQQIIDRSGIVADLSLLRDEQDKEKITNVEEFVNSLQSFVDSEQEDIIDALTGEQISIKDKTLDVFLQQVALMSNIDTEQEQEQEQSYVNLMTVHTAKGLEFNSVFVVGMEEGLFPSLMNVASKENVEEERRLFYVALTRAKQHLFLSNAKVRYRYGNTIFCEQSRFVEEIDDKYLVSENVQDKEPVIENIFTKLNKQALQLGRDTELEPLALKKRKPLTTLRRNTLTNNHSVFKKKDDDKLWRVCSSEELQEGQIVKHSVFGIGRIVELYKEQEDYRARVKFESQEQEKILILKFAKLKIKIQQ